MVSNAFKVIFDNVLLENLSNTFFYKTLEINLKLLKGVFFSQFYYIFYFSLRTPFKLELFSKYTIKRTLKLFIGIVLGT